jgi:hypothetical protein
MEVHEISRQDWPGALEGFSRAHRGWLVSIASAKVDGPLRSVQTEGGSIVVQVGEAAALRIDAPVAVRVDDLGLEIEAAGGVTRLRFRASALPETLDGIAPAER